MDVDIFAEKMKDLKSQNWTTLEELRQLNHKRRKLENQTGQTVNEYLYRNEDEDFNVVVATIATVSKIRAVKLVYEYMDCGLREALNTVNALMRKVQLAR